MSTLWDQDRLRDPHASEDKALRVREMFDRIAPTYQRVNTMASAGRDQAWRRRLVRMAEVKEADRVVDIACGTGDLAECFRVAGAREVLGLDFAREMLLNFQARKRSGVPCCQGDALSLPLDNGCCDITSCAFGVRNFQDLRTGLAEMFRVLRPGGRSLILEFSMPQMFGVRHAYQFYFERIMPRLATWVSRDGSGAYRYLPRSVQSFAGPEEIGRLLREVGFARVEVRRMTLGVVYLFKAVKSA